MSKDITIIISDEETNNSGQYLIHVPSVWDLYNNPDFGLCCTLLLENTQKLQELVQFDGHNSFNFFRLIICELGQFGTFRAMADKLRSGLSQLLPDFNIDFHEKELKLQDLTITEEIWDYILYIVKLSCGEKVTQPLTTFISEEAKQFYLAQLKNEERIKQMRQKGSQDKDQLIKVFLAIIYSFPALTIDYLFNQTLAQIYWLQNYAAGAVSYGINAQAFAAGNVKKGSKLDFFIK